MDKDIFNKHNYFYELPEELIAQKPVEPRDSSRLLVYDRQNDEVEHKHFYDIIDYLKPNDILVVNKTKVLPARLFGEKVDTNAKIEILLQKRIDLKHWDVLVKPAKRAKVGTIIKISDELSCKVIEEGDYGARVIEFIFNGVFEDILYRVGTMPLPHYIKNNETKLERYQTVYAKDEGSSAAPTAGLHFTNELIEKIKNKGIQIVEVLLHVGVGTFRPVKTDNILEHTMHSEYYQIGEEECKILNKAKENNQRIIAVGTTSVRVLESASTQDGKLIAGSGFTNIFIYPSYKFKVVDALITNFHLPESTLIMLVSALCGIENTMKIYNLAVKDKYRFFSFGDAMFIH
ncbi:MAG: tRNA preQ1(34) S-adenosylmethionine ribosyltransferase-isomerase QueA [Clostridia bacterium]|nr:tRNA preQ1(34) S-adenosylmethionine ribosyltransferase-isomerase QueA [Clostridia bacterium]